MQKPERKFSCGSITASLWTRTKVVNGETLTFHSLAINKAYKDGEDWKYTNSFNIEDLPKVALVANEAYRHVRLREDTPL